MSVADQTQYADYLTRTLPGAVKKSYPLFANEAIEIESQKLKDVCRVLKNECGFTMLLDISAIDWLKHPRASEKTSRFELDYFFYNVVKNERVQLKVAVPGNEKPQVDSIVEIFSIADWSERECYDMMGIVFRGHPNLKRLLMWEAFEGYPLRKDYPLEKRQPIPVLDEILT